MYKPKMFFDMADVQDIQVVAPLPMVISPALTPTPVSATKTSTYMPEVD